MISIHHYPRHNLNRWFTKESWMQEVIFTNTYSFQRTRLSDVPNIIWREYNLGWMFRLKRITGICQMWLTSLNNIFLITFPELRVYVVWTSLYCVYESVDACVLLNKITFSIALIKLKDGVFKVSNAHMAVQTNSPTWFVIAHYILLLIC